MTPHDQRLALAELDGYTHVGDMLGVYPGIRGGPVELPNYDDLNALRRLEEKLPKDRHWHYIKELVELTKAEWTDAYEEVFVVVHASAAQKAEALLRATGRWKEL